MGRITRQQIRVFAMFSVAFFMTGLAYAFSLRGETPIAVASVLTVFGFAAALVFEARDS